MGLKDLLFRKKLSSNRRKADILLIHPPWFRLQNSNLVPFPVGPCYIAAVLEKHGLDALVWNGDYDFRPAQSMGGTNLLNTQELVDAHQLMLERLKNRGDPIWNEVVSILQIVQPRIVGISAYSASFQSAQQVARIVKKYDPNIKVVLGGIHGTIAREEIFKSSKHFDVVVVGEAEKYVSPLFSKLLQKKENRELKDIPGLLLTIDGKVHFTGEPERIANLDEIPWPARHRLIDLDKMPAVAHQPVFGYRGCPFRCIFCGSHNMFGRKPRLRSAKSMIDEMEHVHNKFGTKYFFICDDLFLYSKDRVKEFCSLIKERKLNFYYTIQTRGEMVDEELLPKLKATGCQHFAIGVEVGDPEIRKKIKKGNKNSDIRRAAKLIKKYDLRMNGFFMFGFPWETKDQMLATVSFMNELNPVVAFPYIVTPAPGTELLEISTKMDLVPSSLDIASFAHTSPQMGLTDSLSEKEKKRLFDDIMSQFSQHNRKSFRRDILTRPFFYFSAAKDAGLLQSPVVLLQYFKGLLH